MHIFSIEFLEIAITILCLIRIAAMLVIIAGDPENGRDPGIAGQGFEFTRL